MKFLTAYTSGPAAFKLSFARRPGQPSIGSLGLCLPVLDEDPRSAL
jgi:hypothetical protein